MFKLATIRYIRYPVNCYPVKSGSGKVISGTSLVLSFVIEWNADGASSTVQLPYNGYLWDRNFVSLCQGFNCCRINIYALTVVQNKPEMATSHARFFGKLITCGEKILIISFYT